MSELLPYGRCPRCGAAGKMRERRPDGDDICEAGHKYPSRDAVPHPTPSADVMKAAEAWIVHHSGLMASFLNPDERKFAMRAYAAGHAAAMLSAFTLDREAAVERMARAICKSGKFECGQGCCALICMENLGEARTKCGRCVDVHGKLAGAALAALLGNDGEG